MENTASKKTPVGPLSIRAMLRAAHRARSGIEVSEEGSISNLASFATVTFNPITQWEKHQKIDTHLKKLQNLFHLHVETNLPQTQIALESLTMDTNGG